ncbi:MAG: hypothetical protein JMDDDDMK_04739 [Acidobacteria bacterium]|nr:hypothetical protein [Acidobacteriota bacterium]
MKIMVWAARLRAAADSAVAAVAAALLPLKARRLIRLRKLRAARVSRSTSRLISTECSSASSLCRAFLSGSIHSCERAPLARSITSKPQRVEVVAAGSAEAAEARCIVTA